MNKKADRRGQQCQRRAVCSHFAFPYARLFPSLGKTYRGKRENVRDRTS